MVNNLKGIFKNNSQKKENNKDTHFDNNKDYWHNEGWTKALDHRGSENGLKVCIQRIYRFFVEKSEKEKEKYKIQYGELNEKNKSLQNKKDKIKNEISKLKGEIENIKEYIRKIKKNPEEIIGEKSEKAGFFIGLTILLFLTVYLFVFYSSASYSAFFKEFSIRESGEIEGLAASIFDPEAVPKALRDGVTELILILTIPFVFLGLGYLIHKFQEGKNIKKYFQILFLISITFVFDSILAYEITKKIYSLNAENSFQVLPPYTLKLAVQSVEFWLIIFAGFVVYLIWGFVFDFVMDAYYKMDKIAVAIKNNREKIHHIQEEIKKYEDEISKIDLEIDVNNSKIERLKAILNGSVTIIDIQKPNFALISFSEGWIEWLSANKKTEKEIQAAHEIVEKFITNINHSNLEK